MTGPDLFGAIAMLVYLVLIAALGVVIVVKCWGAFVTEPNAGCKSISVWPLPEVFLTCIDKERALMIVALSMGAIGGTVHCLRSLYWYVGNGWFKASWLAFYFLIPLASGVLSFGILFVIKAGLFSNASSGTTDAANPYGVAGFSFIIGLFSQQAMLKLKQVAETLFAAPAPGSDALPQGEKKPTVPEFTLTPNPASLTGTKENPKVAATLTLTALNGFSEAVTLTVAGSPAGVTNLPTITPATVIPTLTRATAQLAIDTTGWPTGAHKLEVTGTSLSKTQKTIVTVTV
jgi:hypothetical protein